MIRNKEMANEVSELMLDFASKLDASLVAVQERCSSEEFHAYREGVSKILSDMLFDVMNPLYLAHPDLKPDELVQ